MPDARSTLAVCCLALIAPIGTASAAVIAEHTGSTDPTTGSPTVWTLGSGGPGTSMTPDAGPPASIRIIDENNTSHSRTYSYSTTVDDRTAAATLGWKLTADVRLNDINDSVDDIGMAAEYAASGGPWFRMLFGTNESGQAIVKVQRHSTIGNASNRSYIVPGSSTSTFHRYELLYDPATTSADLFVDGVEAISDIPQGNLSQNRVIFGAANSVGLGDANFALVRFETVPEPAALALLGLGATVVGFRRRA